MRVNIYTQISTNIYYNILLLFSIQTITYFVNMNYFKEVYLNFKINLQNMRATPRFIHKTNKYMQYILLKI